MTARPVRLPRPLLFTEEELQRIADAGARILAQLGLRVLHPQVREAAGRRGLRVRGDRVFPDRRAIAECAQQARAEGRAHQADEPEAGGLKLYTCQYPSYVHDLDTDTVVPFTTARLIEAAKLVDVLAPEGVIGGAPGIPSDAPQYLRPLLQYKIQAEHCRHGRTPVDGRWARTVPYVMDMAEALGRPIRSLPVYVASPLTIGAESLECVMRLRGRLDYVWTSNMSSAGGSAPIRLADALALAVGEVMGSAIVLRAVTDLPVGWSVRVCAFDLRGMAMSFGGPEDLLFHWACDELNAFCHGRQPGRPGGQMRTQAKLPGPQASAEKMAGIAAGALIGSRSFDGAGTLSLDEVFSAEQLVVDCELRDHVQRLIAGVETDCDPQACAAEVAAGVDGGFMTLDSTLSRYRDIYWLPKFFERRSLAGWLGAGSPDMRARAKQRVRDLVRQHQYELDPPLQREIDRIYRAAARELAD